MNSKNGFQSKVWGPYAWFFLHIVTLNYNPDRKKGYMTFFRSLKDVLPCGACRENYKRIIKSSNPKLRLSEQNFASRVKIARWLFRVHIKVQTDIYGKSGLKKDYPIFNDTKADFMRAMKEYEKYRAQCAKVSYGCVTPLNGNKKKSLITIVNQ